MKDDTISRRAAEDIVRFECGEWTGLAETIVKRFEALPSAQPEPIRLRLDHELTKEEYERLKKDCAEQPIILLPKESAQPGEDIRAMCGECDAWNQYKNYPQPRWIPVVEHLPKKDGDYLVTTYSGQIARYIFIGGSSEEYWRRCATAWMPLPTPYREGGLNE